MAFTLETRNAFVAVNISDKKLSRLLWAKHRTPKTPEKFRVFLEQVSSSDWVLIGVNTVSTGIIPVFGHFLVGRDENRLRKRQFFIPDIFFRFVSDSLFYQKNIFFLFSAIANTTYITTSIISVCRFNTAVFEPY